MRILGFRVKKILCEKNKEQFNNLKINNKIDIQKIEKMNIEEKRGSILEIDFLSLIDYQQDIAKIEINGSMIVEVDNEQAKEILNQWKTKKIESSFKIELFNFILRRTSVKALELEEEIGLPYHIPFPRITGEEKK